MNKCYKVLIIDDHPAIVDAFKNALNFISTESDRISFNVESAEDCVMAYNKIKELVLIQKLDLVILDIKLPPAPNFKIHSGQDLGVMIRELLPDTKILVCTSYSDNHRLYEILKAFNPNGFVNKQDLNILGFVTAIEDVLNGKTFYSQTIINMLKQKSLSNMTIDDFDILILKELANGSKMKDLVKLIHLSKSAIDKRKRLLKRKFNVDSNSDRSLVLAARLKGFI
jgi:DNA-binding NarL/FixJ family response regulator